MTILKKGIIFGPWVGEFGWELFAWHGHCRAISKLYDFTIVISRTGNSYLYSDFCNLYLPFDPPVNGVPDSHMNSEVQDFNVQDFLRATVSVDILGSHEWSWVAPQKIGNPPYDHWQAPVPVVGVGDVIPQYRLLRGKIDKCSVVDVVLHARHREIREIDNWQIEKWNEVVCSLGSDISVACIGRKSDSVLIEGAIDCRDKDLGFVVGLFRYASCAVGSSSGPLHLATLSGCPQVWWTSNPKQNFARYKHTWNPFDIDTCMLDGVDPNPHDVIEKIRSM